MNTRAPALRALIIIFGSAGPVISTRRSSRSTGAGATRQSAERTAAVSSGKSGARTGPELAHASPPCRQDLGSSGTEPSLEVGHDRQRIGVSTASEPGTSRPTTCTPGGMARLIGRPSAEPSPR